MKGWTGHGCRGGTPEVATATREIDYRKRFGAPAGTVVADRWYRFILSGDLSGTASVHYSEDVNTSATTYSINSTQKLYLAVDDTDFSPTSSLSGTTGTVTTSPGDVLPEFYIQDTNGVVLIAYGFGAGPGDWRTFVSGIPSFYNSKFELADFMMWTGVSLDTSDTANRRLFIDVDGNPGVPSVAIAALGAPVYDFRGPASGISTNNGSAGSVTKTGTITDFTPGP